MKTLNLFLLFALGVLFSGCTNSYAYMPEEVDGQGTLVIQGGGNRHPDIVKAIIDNAGGKDSKILVVPFASGYADEVGPEQAKEFADAGCPSADYILCAKEDLDKPENMEKLRGVTGIFFSGGDQNRLVAYLEGTNFLEAIRRLYAAGAVVAGTSAGAAVMSDIMLTGNATAGNSDDFNYFKEGAVETSKGFGFLKSIIIDQHFVARKRQVRLMNVLLDNPGYRGIGIDEATAIVVKHDNTMTVVGASKVLMYEPVGQNSYKLTVLSAGESRKL